MTRIAIEDLQFRRKGRPPILRGISFAAEAGEIVSIIGPNGAGKSTLLRCLIGAYTSWSGEIRVGDRDVRSLGRRQLATALSYVPQSSSSAFSYSVFECVLLGRSPHLTLGLGPGRKDHAAVESAIRQAGVEALAGRRLDELSGGERQLVLIARALAQDAPIVVMDEPTASLDLANQSRVLRLIAELARSGRTVLMTSHLPEQAFLLQATVVAMKQGAVIATGPAHDVCTEQRLEELYETPLQVLTQTGPPILAACLPRL